MPSKKILFSLFSLGLLLVVFLGFLLLNLFYSPNNTNSAVSSFFWLKPGTKAVYSLQDAMLGFDDHGWANPVRGNYSLICVERNDPYAKLEIEVDIEVFQPPEWKTPGSISYVGKEFVDKAARGDLSFIKRVPIDQVIGRVQLINTAKHQEVRIPSPIVISQNFTVVIDLHTMQMIGDNGEPWGKWALWIDPLKYPIEGTTEELFIMNWLNTSVYLNVTYHAPPNSIPQSTVLGEVKRYFSATTFHSIENDFLKELGVSGLNDILPCYHYEARTGVFLRPTLFDYLDDILTQKFGIIKTHAYSVSKLPFTLSSTNIQVDLQ